MTTPSLNNLDQVKRSGELLELAYSKIKDMIADNFDIFYHPATKHSYNGVLSKYPISVDDAKGYGNQSVWIHLMRYLSKDPKILPSISLTFKGGLSTQELDDIPIQSLDSKCIFRNTTIQQHEVNGIQSHPVLTRFNDLLFIKDSGMECILSRKRDKDILCFLRQAYDRYLFQIESGIQF